MSRNRDIPPVGQGEPWSEREQRNARRAYSRLGRAGQFELLEEVVLTRGPELRRAYPDLVGIGFGFKTKRKEARGAPQLLRIPCIVFEVRRKPPFGRRVAAVRELPRVLYAFAAIDDRRCLCELPTDIRESQDFGHATPHDGSDKLPFGIAVCDDENSDATGGTLTCAVERGDGKLYALSCRHVLSRSLELLPDMRPRTNVRLRTTDGLVIGKPTAIRGPFLTSPAASFDAQLVKVSDGDSLKSALGGLRFDPEDPVLRSSGQVPNGFWVATPRSDPKGRRVYVWVTLIGLPVLRPMPYPFPDPLGEVQVAHRLVIHAKAGSHELKGGDSGAPAVLLKSGSKLIGMYLGGDGTNAYFIPAWELFLPANYGLPAGQAWGLRTSW